MSRRSSRRIPGRPSYPHRLSPFAKNSVDRSMAWKRSYGRRLGVEALEDRRMLAVDVFLDGVTGLVTIMDESGQIGGQVQEDNEVTLSLGNFDPDGGEAAGAQDGLLITAPDGVNAIGTGILQVSPTQAFVPQDFDFNPGIGANIQNVLTATVVIDLQDGDDNLTFAGNVASVPVVTDYEVRGGGNGLGSDVLVFNGSAGQAEAVDVRPNFNFPEETTITGYAGVAIDAVGYEEVVFEGEGDNDEIIYALGAGVANAQVRNAAFSNGDVVTSDVLPNVYFRGIDELTVDGSNEPAEVAFVLDTLSGATSYTFDSNANDTLVVLGAGANELFAASLDGAGNLEVSNGAATIGTTGMTDGDLLRVETLGGDDELEVRVVGTDLIDVPIFFDGGEGSDLLSVQGDPTPVVQRVTYSPGLQPDEGRLEYDVNIIEAGLDMVIDFDNLEPVVDLVVANTLTVNGDGANNAITYTEGSSAARGLVSIDGFETIEFENKTNLVLDGQQGDDTIVINNANVPTLLSSATAVGGDGNDVIRFEALPDASASAFSEAAAGGGGGDDLIDGSMILVNTPLTFLGDEGDDTLLGGAGSDDLAGNAGNDTLVDSRGNDIMEGGAGVDTLEIRGTHLNDVIDVFQNAPSAGALDLYTLNVTNGGFAAVDQIGKTNGAAAPNDPNNRPDIERIVIDGMSGDDIVRVGHADAYEGLNPADGQPSQTIRFEVNGDSPNATDQLIVQDDLIGDLVIHREGPDDRSGSVTVAGFAPVDYSNMEFVHISPLDPITGGTGTDGLGRLVVFKHDPFEANNTLPNATFLGAGPTINVDPTIDPGGIPLFNVPGDNDFYQFVAQETGTLDLQLYFEPIGTLANGRMGLPVDGELTATVLDSDGVPVSIATASDLLDPNGIKIGERVTVPVVRNNTYYLRVEGEAGDQVTGINVYNFTAITTPAPIPELVDLQAASDTGRNNTDDETKDTTPTFNIILDDDRIDEFMNIDLAPDTVDDDLPTANFDYGVEVFNNAVSIGYAYFTGVGNTWEFTATAGDLNEGDFNHISAAVWIRDAADPAQLGRHELSQALQVTLDTINPPVFFGLDNAVDDEDGLAADSDTGVTTMPMTFSDRITSDTTPRLWGRAEANTIVTVWHDDNGNGIIDLLSDTFLGQTVATPLDGNLAFPEGYWELTTVLDLNEIVGLPKDGLRSLLVSAEDVAGNPMPMNDQIDVVDQLDIFIDTQGPQVTDVTIDGSPSYDLFDPKPSVDGPTPLVNALNIDFIDQPNRLAGDFLYFALKNDIATNPGNYLLVGDHVGIIAIQSVVVTASSVADGAPSFATVTLTFVDPLPDDRFTLTVSDNLVDPAGNNLDGESNADEPQEDPTFPSGDGVPGGDFVARFTIDTRPEIGSYVAQNIDLDINGNFVWDPANGQIGNDATNFDLTFTLGLANSDGSIGQGGYNVHDLAFAGKFHNTDVAAPTLFFDQLAAFGWSAELNARRWLIDTDSDGVITLFSTDIFTLQPDVAGFNVAGAIPVAGNFDANLANGDEIGLYNAGAWALDTNRNFIIDPADTFLAGDLFGHPVVGDFDGNGDDDLAVFNNNTLFFDMNPAGFDGNTDDTFVWGYPGVLDRPVAADMDYDSIDDIGLWVPRNSAQDNRVVAEWYFLISGFPAPGNVAAAVGTANLLDHPFEPVPFGNDIYAEFGDELALPIVGNFDPPVASAPAIDPNFILEGDFDGSGVVDQGDYDLWRSTYGSTTNFAADGNGDGRVDAADYGVWRGNLGATAPAAAAAPAAAPVADSSASNEEAAAIRRGIIDAAITAVDNGPAPAAAFAFDSPVVASQVASGSRLSDDSQQVSDHDDLLLQLALRRVTSVDENDASITHESEDSAAKSVDQLFEESEEGLSANL